MIGLLDPWGFVVQLEGRIAFAEKGIRTALEKIEEAHTSGMSTAKALDQIAYYAGQSAAARSYLAAAKPMLRVLRRIAEVQTQMPGEAAI